MIEVSIFYFVVVLAGFLAIDLVLVYYRKKWIREKVKDLKENGYSVAVRHGVIFASKVWGIHEKKGNEDNV